MAILLNLVKSCNERCRRLPDNCVSMIRHSTVMAVWRTNTTRVMAVIESAVRVAVFRYSGFNNSG